MNRAVSTLLIALVPLLLLAAVITTSATSLDPRDVESTETAVSSLSATVRGSVVWAQLAVLPPDATVTVRLVDVSRSDGTVVMLGEQAMSIGANPYPAQFAIPYDPARIRPGGLYAVAGDITVGDTLEYRSTNMTQVITHGSTNSVHLFLSRVGPLSSFDDVVGSGRLAHFSYY
jgi:putative lipoprotein